MVIRGAPLFGTICSMDLFFLFFYVQGLKSEIPGCVDDTQTCLQNHKKNNGFLGSTSNAEQKLKAGSWTSRDT